MFGLGLPEIIVLVLLGFICAGGMAGVIVLCLMVTFRVTRKDNAAKADEQQEQPRA